MLTAEGASQFTQTTWRPGEERERGAQNARCGPAVWTAPPVCVGRVRHRAGVSWALEERLAWEGERAEGEGS